MAKTYTCWKTMMDEIIAFQKNGFQVLINTTKNGYQVILQKAS